MGKFFKIFPAFASVFTQFFRKFKFFGSAILGYFFTHNVFAFFFIAHLVGFFLLVYGMVTVLVYKAPPLINESAALILPSNFFVCFSLLISFRASVFVFNLSKVMMLRSGPNVPGTGTTIPGSNLPAPF